MARDWSTEWNESEITASLTRERNEMFAKYDSLMMKYRRAEANAVVLMRKLEERIRERDEARAECERLREVAHAAHHLLCNKHLMCADPDDDGSLDHYLRLLQDALDAARANAAE